MLISSTIWESSLDTDNCFKIFSVLYVFINGISLVCVCTRFLSCVPVFRNVSQTVFLIRYHTMLAEKLMRM